MACNAPLLRIGALRVSPQQPRTFAQVPEEFAAVGLGDAATERLPGGNVAVVQLELFQERLQFVEIVECALAQQPTPCRQPFRLGPSRSLLGGLCGTELVERAQCQHR